jgi:hypothetical protein
MGLDGQCPTPDRSKGYYLFHNIQTSSVMQPAPKAVNIVGCFSEGKAAGAYSLLINST